MKYHTDISDPHNIGFSKAIVKAVSEAANNGTNQVLLLIHGLQNLQGVISSVFGDAVAKQLKENKIIKSGPVTIYLETERYRSTFEKGVIIAPFASLKLLAITASDYRATDVIFVPWAESEFKSYIKDNPTSVQL